jgi:integrase
MGKALNGKNLPTGINQAPSALYRARYRDEAGKLHAKSFATMKDAVAWRIARLAEVNAGTHVVSTDGKTTVADYAYRWASTRLHHKATTRRRITGSIDVHLAPLPLGKRPLAAVLPTEIQNWVKDRSDVLKPSTLAVLYALLKSIFASAVDDRLIRETPCIGRISLPKVRRKERVVLTVGQVTDIADSMAPRYRAMVVAQAGLGLRVSELLALQLHDVNFLKRTVRITRQVTPDGRGYTDPKTERSTRTIPLTQQVAEALAEHIKLYPPLEDGLLFYSRQGNPYSPGWYSSDVFPEASRKAGLPEIRPHDLRHFFASVLVEQGVDVVTTAAALGDRPEEVMRTYAHLMPSAEDKTRAVLEAVWGGLGVAHEDASSL